MKIEYILPLHIRSTPQPQRLILPQRKGLGKIFKSSGPKKQAVVAILISNGIDFKLKSIKRDKKRTFYTALRKNTSRGNLNTEHLCPKHKGTIINKRKTTKA